MTLEDDVRLLREEVDRLKAVDREKSRRLEDLESQVAVWNVNGAENLLGGYGFTQVAEAVRIGRGGMQVISDQSDGDITAQIWLVKDFFTPIGRNGYPANGTDGIRILGNVIAGNDIYWEIWGSNNIATTGTEYTGITGYVGPGATSTLSLFALKTGGNAAVAGMDLESNIANGGRILLSGRLRLQRVTSDPSATLTDGEMWYRTDTDKFRGRANDTTDSFAMEAWVTSGFVAAGTVILGAGTELTIATGAITITSGYHRVDTQSDGGTDDLDTISGGTTGQLLVLRAENDARDVVVKDGTGNIQLDGGVDFTLDSVKDTITLLYDGSTWNELSRSDNGA